MASIYPAENSDSMAPASATLTITDGSKCGELDDINSPLRRILSHIILATEIRDVKIVNYKTRFVLHLLDGQLYPGKLLKPDSPEELSFAYVNNGQPIGKFIVKDKEDKESNS
jgi:hypothetical protein